MTPTITIIAAVADNGAIGRKGQLLYHISADLRRFKQLTMGKPIIMGRRTFESLPKGALPGRRNIVITRNPSFSAPGVERAGSLDEAIALAGDVTEVMVIGGGQVYAEALPQVSRLELTLIHTSPDDADTFFPPIDPDGWQLTETSAPASDERTSLNYTFVCLCRK